MILPALLLCKQAQRLVERDENGMNMVRKRNGNGTRMLPAVLCRGLAQRFVERGVVVVVGEELRGGAR
jgi:hypothetical protein